MRRRTMVRMAEVVVRPVVMVMALPMAMLVVEVDQDSNLLLIR